MNRLPPEEVEEKYVNSVYDVIAPHFDSTRYKPWPGVKNFVESLPNNSLIIDVGCGNGRNLGINSKCYDIGTDFSMPLCKIAAQRQKPIFCASALDLPIRDGTFDHVICIAVIHHFASVERRVQCLREIARIMRVGGTAYVTAWALTQPKKTFTESDQMVPWKVKKEFDEKQTNYDRYYHFFAEGEFAELVAQVPNLKFIKQVWEAGNYDIIVEKIE